MNANLMSYIPKEYKKLVVNILEGALEYNEITRKAAHTVIVEWENGEILVFANKSFMKFALKEFHSPDEFLK